MAEPRQGDYRDKSDVELFKLIQLAGRSSPAARNAYQEVFRRYGKGVQAHGRMLYSSTLKCSDDVQEFTQRVFVDFWKRGIFAFDCAKVSTSAAMTKLVRYWLARQGEWVIAQWHREANPARQPVPATSAEINPNDILAVGVLNDNDSRPTVYGNRLALARLGLSLREHDVVVTCTKYYDPINRQCRVDDETVKSRLMRDHNFENWAAVRKCLERTLKKLKRSILDKADVA